MTQFSSQGSRRVQEAGVGGSSPVSALLSTALNDGEVLADDGKSYSTVQEAENNSGGWVFIGPGSFVDNVTVSTQGMFVGGTGESSLVDGSSSGDTFTVTSTDVSFKDIAVRTDVGSGNDSFRIESSGCSLYNCINTESGSGMTGTASSATDLLVSSSIVENTDATAIGVNGNRAIVSGCVLGSGIGGNGVDGQEDRIVSNNIINGVGGDGIVLRNDSLTGGNRIISVGSDGVRVSGAANDCIVYNNRISGSAANDISDGGTGTVLDANLTGPSN